MSSTTQRHAIDPTNDVVLVKIPQSDREADPTIDPNQYFKDVSEEVEWTAATADPNKTAVKFKNSSKNQRAFKYLTNNVFTLIKLQLKPLPADKSLFVDGEEFPLPCEYASFTDPKNQSWVRIRSLDQATILTVPHRRFLLRRSQHVAATSTRRPATAPAVNDTEKPAPAGASGQLGHPILTRWHDQLASRPSVTKAPVTALQKIGNYSTDSALHTYFEPDTLASEALVTPPIFPCRTNGSQAAAIDVALHHKISLIHGGAGTGKTETVLNLAATLIAAGKSVCIITQDNQTIDSLHQRACQTPLGLVAARLGNGDAVKRFYRTGLNSLLNKRDTWSQAKLPLADPEVAELRHRIGANRQWLEKAWMWHLEQMQHRQRCRTIVAKMHYLDCHARSYDKNLTYPESVSQVCNELFETFGYDRLTSTGPAAEKSRAWAWAKRMFTFPSRQEQTDVLVSDWRERICRLAEDAQKAQADELAASQRQHDAGRAALARQLQAASSQLLDNAVLKIIAKTPDSIAKAAATGAKPPTADLLTAFPLILSTSLSVANNLPADQLCDVIIIDEASRISASTAAAGLSRAKHAVVVGDFHLLQPITGARKPSQKNDTAGPDSVVSVDGDATREDDPRYDGDVSIMESLRAVFGRALPQRELIEQYRTDPAIVDFCNLEFYGGKLVPFRKDRPKKYVLALARTVKGKHARSIGTSKTNLRQVAVATRELAETDLFPHYSQADMAVVSPYKGFINDAQAEFGEDSTIVCDTIHGMQGREIKALMVATVIDDDSSQQEQSFVDSKEILATALTRVQESLTLVTSHEGLPKTRYIRDLQDFIAYHSPDTVIQSRLVSIFDATYSDCDPSLTRRKHHLTDHHTSDSQAENLMRDELARLLQYDDFAELQVGAQVPLSTFIRLRHLSGRKAEYVRQGARLDFAIVKKQTRTVLLGIEVQGRSHSADHPKRQRNDALKRDILENAGVPLLAFETAGHSEHDCLLRALRECVGLPATPPAGKGPTIPRRLRPDTDIFPQF